MKITVEMLRADEATRIESQDFRKSNRVEQKNYSCFPLT
jgi:hypothetical protein